MKHALRLLRPEVDPPELAAARDLRAQFGNAGSLLVARYVAMLAAIDLDERRERNEVSHDDRRALVRLQVAARSLTRAMRLLMRRFT